MKEVLEGSLDLETLPYPGRFRAGALMGKFAKPFAGISPQSMQPMLALLPTSLPKHVPLQEVYPAVGERRARVAPLGRVCTAGLGSGYQCRDHRNSDAKRGGSVSAERAGVLWGLVLARGGSRGR
jgi:hypothetical protein